MFPKSDFRIFISRVVSTSNLKDDFKKNFKKYSDYIMELRDELEWILEEYKYMRKTYDFKKMNTRLKRLEDKVRQLERKSFSKRHR